MIIGAFGLGIASILGYEINTTSVNSQEITTTSVENREFISDDLFGLHMFFFGAGNYGGMTNLQMEETWELDYEDKYVNWTGFVKNIDEGLFSGLTILVCKEPITGPVLSADAAVKMKKSEKDKLTNYGVGDVISFQARLDDYGDIMKTFYLEDGIVIE